MLVIANSRLRYAREGRTREKRMQDYCEGSIRYMRKLVKDYDVSLN